MKFKHYILQPKSINEASYMGNLGFEELVRFYQEAGNSDIKKMETIIANSDWEGFKKMIYKILRVSLK